MPITRGPAPFYPLILPADHELVLSTSMLDWTPLAPAAAGGPQRVSLDLFKAVRAFLGRCSLSKEQADQNVFSQTPFLRFDLTNAAWDRILDEYVDSELPQLLQDAGVRSLGGFDETVNKLTPANPDNFIISNPDLLLRDAFDTAAIPARPARARQAAVPAVDAVAGPPELAFLNLCTLPLLEDRGSAILPLLPLARLAGMVGPFSTAEKRTEVVSTIQLTGALLRQQLGTRFGCAADGAMAVNLKDFLLDTYLPGVFSAHRASEEELRREARDACTYRRSAQGRADVEISRISYLRFRCDPSSLYHIPPTLWSLLVSCHARYGGRVRGHDPPLLFRSVRSCVHTPPRQLLSNGAESHTPSAPLSQGLYM